MREVYLDNAATTKVRPEIAEAMAKAMVENYGNPSSIYKAAQHAATAIAAARQQVADLIGASPKEIIFTGGGSEGDNMLIKGVAHANVKKGRHIITTQVEHHAVLHTCEELAKEGFEITYLPVDEFGRVTAAQVEAALRDDTILVSVMYANNEIGTIMPIREIGAVCRAHKVLLHTDAVQAAGHIPIDVTGDNIDLLTLTAHKFHGPKGVGFLYINEKVRVQPQILGGGQQSGMRSGTDNVPGIAGLGVAADMVYTDFDKKIQQLYALKERMAEGLSKLGDITVNGMPLMEGAPHIMSVTFHGVRSEVLLHTLEEFGVYISAGSACSSHKRKPSATLTAMGLSRADVESTVRISFCEENTFEEVDYCLEALGKTIPMLRRYARR